MWVTGDLSHRSPATLETVSLGSCVTSITGPNGDAQLYER